MSFWDLCTAVLVGIFPGLSSDSSAVCSPSFRTISIPRDIKLVSSVFIADAAVQVGNPSVIYYNQNFIRTLGPQMAHFVLAHEVGHIVLDYHRPQDADSDDREALDEAMQEQEAQTDCWAARLISEANPFAIEAAISYFKRLGEWRTKGHPSSMERAAIVERCSSPVRWQKFLFSLPRF